MSTRTSVESIENDNNPIFIGVPKTLIPDGLFFKIKGSTFAELIKLSENNLAEQFELDEIEFKFLQWRLAVLKKQKADANVTDIEQVSKHSILIGERGRFIPEEDYRLKKPVLSLLEGEDENNIIVQKLKNRLAAFAAEFKDREGRMMTVYDLLQTDKSQIKNYRQIGVGSYRFLRDKLAELIEDIKKVPE